MPLDNLRKRIDELDDAILKALDERPASCPTWAGQA